MPDDILPVWDEITADVTGLLCATGRYDAEVAAEVFATLTKIAQMADTHATEAPFEFLLHLKRASLLAY